MGDIADGVAAYAKAIALDPQNVDAHFNIAQARKEVHESSIYAVEHRNKTGLRSWRSRLARHSHNVKVIGSSPIYRRSAIFAAVGITF